MSDALLHALAAAALGAVVVVLYISGVKTAIGFTVGFALIWPAREIFQHGPDIFSTHVVLEWVPPMLVTAGCDVLGRVARGRT